MHASVQHPCHLLQRHAGCAPHDPSTCHMRCTGTSSSLLPRQASACSMDDKNHLWGLGKAGASVLGCMVVFRWYKLRPCLVRGVEVDGRVAVAQLAAAAQAPGEQLAAP